MQKTAFLWISCRPYLLLVWSVSRQRGGGGGGVVCYCRRIRVLCPGRVGKQSPSVGLLVASCRADRRSAGGLGVWLAVSCVRNIERYFPVWWSYKKHLKPHSADHLPPVALLYTSLSRHPANNGISCLD